MPIKSVKIKDFLVFKGEFKAHFCPGINILLGANGTGKTTLLKALYAMCNINTATAKLNNKAGARQFLDIQKIFRQSPEKTSSTPAFNAAIEIELEPVGKLKIELDSNLQHPFWQLKTPKKTTVSELEPALASSVYIPEKDLLANAKGLPETYEYGRAQFTQVEIDIIKKARILPDGPEPKLYRRICEIIQAEPENDGESFFMKRAKLDTKIPFSMEASGYRRLALLAILIRNRQLSPGTVLFWDEPENSLNPELLPVLVDTLLELTKNRIQVFLATHDYNLTRYFDIRRQQELAVKFHNLMATAEAGIVCKSSEKYLQLCENRIELANEKLYDAVIDKAIRGLSDA